MQRQHREKKSMEDIQGIIRELKFLREQGYDQFRVDGNRLIIYASHEAHIAESWRRHRRCVHSPTSNEVRLFAITLYAPLASRAFDDVDRIARVAKIIGFTDLT